MTKNIHSESWYKSKLSIDLIIIGIGLGIVSIFAIKYDISEIIVGYVQKHKDWELDELITISIYLVFSFVFFSIRRWFESVRSEKELKRSLDNLQKALAEVKQLKGILPICTYCKKIRDDEGYWHKVEEYIQQHSEADISHSLCPKCRIIIYEDVEK